jgi:cytochrome c peroxidase
LIFLFLTVKGRGSLLAASTSQDLYLSLAVVSATTAAAIDASRSATKMYSTTPLQGNWQHPPYFHNGVAPTQEAMVQTYIQRLNLGLSAQEIQDLAQYLKSL